MDIDSAMVFLDSAVRFIPRTFFPGVRISLIQAPAFRTSQHPGFHLRLMSGRHMIERLVFRMVHQISNGLTCSHIFLRNQQRPRMIISASQSVADKNHPFPFLRHFIVSRTKDSNIHIISYLSEVFQDFLLDLSSEHRAESLYIITDNIARLRCLTISSSSL